MNLAAWLVVALLALFTSNGPLLILLFGVAIGMAVTYHAKYGEAGTVTVTPEMLAQ